MSSSKNKSWLCCVVLAIGIAAFGCVKVEEKVETPVSETEEHMIEVKATPMQGKVEDGSGYFVIDGSTGEEEGFNQRETGEVKVEPVESEETENGVADEHKENESHITVQSENWIGEALDIENNQSEVMDINEIERKSDMESVLALYIGSNEQLYCNEELRGYIEENMKYDISSIDEVFEGTVLYGWALREYTKALLSGSIDSINSMINQMERFKGNPKYIEDVARDLGLTDLSSQESDNEDSAEIIVP